ncbi:MAG: hypothetical protein E6649_02485 [Paeniclostridium sordellii]|nr:hypothetical protein [Paeniclostridium sordellii]
MKENIEVRKQKIIIGIIIFIIISIIGLIIIKKLQLNKNQHMKAQGPELYTVPQKEKVVIDGEIKPIKSEEFFIDRSKALDNINVENGQIVEQGSVLFTCKDESIKPKIDFLKDYIEIKNSTKDATKFSENTDENLLNSKINEIESNASVSVIAPFKGKVYINEPISNKNDVNPLITLSSPDLCIKGLITEENLPKVALNQNVEIFVNPTNEHIKGKISFIDDRPSKNINNDKKKNVSYYSIKIDFLENQDLSRIKDGFHVKSTMEAINSKIKVPYSALGQDGEKKYVYKVIDGVIYKQEVKTAEVTDKYAIITEGVGENDKIIKYAKNKSIKDGDTISYSHNNKSKK